MLVDGQIDHTTGLLMLREGKPLEIWCTDMVHEDLTTGNPLFHILGHYCGVNWHRLPIEPGNDFAIDGIEHLRFASVALKSKAPPYSPHRDNPHEGDNIGMRITDTRSRPQRVLRARAGRDRAASAAAAARRPTRSWWTAPSGPTTRWSAWASRSKRARDIGHLPQSGEGGMIERAAAPAGVAQNPHPHQQHQPDPERGFARARASLTRAGIEVAYDGMEIEL